MSNYAHAVGAKTRTAEENRAGEMRKELNDMGIYEEGMTAKEMEDMLQAINVSKTSVGDQSRDSAMEIESNHKQRSRDSLSPDLPAFSNKQKDRRNSNEPEKHAELPRARETTEPDASYLMSPSPPRGTTPQIPESQNVNVRKPPVQTKLHPHLYTTPKTEKWKLDPFDCKKDDAPALKARRNQTAKSPMRYPVVNGAPQLPKEIMNLMNMQLDEIAREYYASVRNDDDFQWGSPIKVGTANGSLDRESRRERSPTPVGEARTKVALHAQPDERKSPDVYTYSNDEENDDFETARKRQKPNTQKFYPIHQARRLSAASSRAFTETDEVIIKDDRDSDLQERRGNQSRKRSIKQRDASQEFARRRERSPEYEALEIRGRQNSDLMAVRSGSSSPEPVEVTPTYPRRIPPPNPSKPRGGRGRKPNMPSLLRKPNVTLTRIDANPKRKKKETMSVEDIEKQLISDDEQQIFVAKSVSKRVEGAAQMLASATEKEEQDERKTQEAERLRREQEQQRNRERLQRQVEEEQQQRKAAAEAKREAEEKEQRYNALLKFRSSGPSRRPELEGTSRPRKILPKPAVWSHSHQGIQPQPRVDNTPTAEVNCPICGRAFPKTEVQNHASTCTDYNGGSDVKDIVERTPSPVDRYTCMKCERYSTLDGHELEEHTAICTGVRRPSGCGSRSEPIQLSDSPIRTYQRVSEIPASDVDYDSMKPNAKKPSPRGGPPRKRKR